MMLLSMLIPLLLLVLVHLLIIATIGLIKQTARSGTLMVGVLGSLVIHVLIGIEIKMSATDILVVLMTPLVVLVSEMSLLVIHIVGVLGVIILNHVLVWMSLLVE